MKDTKEEVVKNIVGIVSANIVILIGTILLGDIIIDLIWGGNKFDIDDVKLAYVFLIFNVLAIFITSLGSIYRKMAISHGKGKVLYTYWTFSQILSAGFAYILIKYFSVVGIYILMPLNAFFMAVVSYFVYIKIKKSNYGLIKNYVPELLLIGLASTIKYLGEFYIKPLFNKEYLIAFFVLTTLLLSLYPVLVIYKKMRVSE